MDRYKETWDTWNKIALQYQERFMDLKLYNSTYDLICDSIPKYNARILEIGCGPGNISRYLLSKRPDFKIDGIDIAPNMIELARKNVPAANFMLMDLRRIDELKTEYDGVIGGFCLPYLSETDSAKLIADCYNLLSKDGLLYLSYVEGDSQKSGFQTGSSGDRSYFYFHSAENLITNLENSNFGNLKEFQIEFKKSEKETDIHTIITAKKNPNSSQ